MKISKKIFGVALALIMIFNVFAVGTFAAFPEDASVKLIVKTDKATYAPGEEIVLTIAQQSTAEVGNLNSNGQYELAYDSTAIELYSTAKPLEDHGFVIDPSQTGYVSAMSQVVPHANNTNQEIYDEDKAAYGWDETMEICVANNDGFVDTVSAPFEFFTIKVRVKADCPDGTYTIGFNPAGYYNYWSYSTDEANGGIYGGTGEESGYSTPNTWEYGTATFTVSSAPAVEVTHDGTQARYAYPGTPSAAAYQFGCLGKVTGLAVETDDANNVTNIQSIVATANYNGSTVSSEVKTMWVDGEAYGFRAVFKGFDYQDTKDITVTFAITMSDGTTVYTTAEAATYTANGIYTAAVGRGMPEIA